MSEAITAAGPRNYLPGDLFERPLRNDYDLIGRLCVCVCDGWMQRWASAPITPPCLSLCLRFPQDQ